MAKVTLYKNSIIASVLSLAGTILALGGVVSLVSGEPAGGIVLILLGVAMMLWASSISERKAFQTWLKAAKEKADIDGMIRASESSAITVYNLRPGKSMLRYICGINHEAGAQIKKRIQETKASKKQNP